MQFMPAETLRVVAARIANLCPDLIEPEQVMVALGEKWDLWPDYVLADLAEEDVRELHDFGRIVGDALEAFGLAREPPVSIGLRAYPHHDDPAAMTEPSGALPV